MFLGNNKNRHIDLYACVHGGSVQRGWMCWCGSVDGCVGVCHNLTILVLASTSIVKC